MDISRKIGLIKIAAAATNPLPNHKLDVIVEEEIQKINKFQNDISNNYDKITKQYKDSGYQSQM